MNPHDYCQDKAAKSGSSFYYSFLFLPPDKRQAITALYAFCREVDDVVDECHDPQLAQTTLGWWRDEVDRIYDGAPTHPVGQALREVVPAYDLPREQLQEIIDGMEMDLDHVRYADFRGLQLYCYRAASVVGLLAARIFGFEDRQTLKYAHDLGIALQLTNIIRDVGEDARRGRIYLPVEELQRFNVPAEELFEAKHSERFVELMRFQAQRAYGFYDQAMAQLPDVDRKNQRPGLVMAAIYRTLLDEIVRDDFMVLDRRTSLTPLRKVWIAGTTWMRA
ncbi:presqualene diphosphate synthase HpnD [Azoarcus taiwanensis]|uniref:Presqualene diphosphate synthase HpnD n=1 Tax=Azoarcus taiwanensis TaxID=666964 RepID=A0A972F7Q5_9RHOO|nr:presqualene diphosphate synthase HpnD [Azoarcus taiwanensis]NMG03409.1 presqualene diphosphate synthase HpnD [Azoarcus taiwanensis]